MSAADALRYIEYTVEKWAHLGSKTLSNGTRLVGYVPHVGPEAWLHEIFPPLCAESRGELVEMFPVDLPDDYLAFLSIANGVRLFSTELCLYGRRYSYGRTGEAMWQPFDIRPENLQERVRGAPRDAFFIGCYPLDGFQVAFLQPGGEIVRCAQDAFHVLQSWPSFLAFITEECDRYTDSFDSLGQQRSRSGADTKRT